MIFSEGHELGLAGFGLFAPPVLTLLSLFLCYAGMIRGVYALCIVVMLMAEWTGRLFVLEALFWVELVASVALLGLVLQDWLRASERK